MSQCTAPINGHTRAAAIPDLAVAGTTVLLTKQSLAEADQMADRIAVLDPDAIVATGWGCRSATSRGWRSGGASSSWRSRSPGWLFRRKAGRR